MTRRLIRGLVLTAAVSIMAPLAAVERASQSTPAPRNDAQEPQVFKSQSDLVVLHINVFDGRSDAVPDLPQSAFRVLEDDKLQDISFFSNADVPVAVGLILDASGSMIGRQHMVIAGGTSFAESSHTEDELFTIHFNEHIKYGLPSGVAFTSRRPLLLSALARYVAGGKTALHDAVIAGLEHLERASLQKRVLVVLSDGEDNASIQSEKEMIAAARRSSAIVYTVSNANRSVGMPGDPGTLRALADATGGVAFFPQSDAAVVESFDKIAGNIRRGYSIGYAPTGTVPDGRFRRVKVKVSVPGRNNLSVRTRDGYRAPDNRGSW